MQRLADRLVDRRDVVPGQTRQALLDLGCDSEHVPLNVPQDAGPSDALLGWLADQPDENLFIASLSVAEIQRGILEKEEGRKRRELEAWFAGPEGPQALFAGRVLPFDEGAALAWGRLMAEGKATGRPRSALDMVIAATAEANGCIVVTGNVRHFSGVVPFLNPLEPTPGNDEA